MLETSSQFRFLSPFLNKWTVAPLATLHLAMCTINLHNSECAHTLSDTVKYIMVCTVCVWVSRLMDHQQLSALHFTDTNTLYQADEMQTAMK